MGDDDEGPRVARTFIGDEEVAVLSFPAGAVGEVEGLTAAEREVLVHLLAGESNREIADARGTAERTVANQVASLFRKLGVASRGELVARLR